MAFDAVLVLSHGAERISGFLVHEPPRIQTDPRVAAIRDVAAPGVAFAHVLDHRRATWRVRENVHACGEFHKLLDASAG